MGVYRAPPRPLFRCLAALGLLGMAASATPAQALFSKDKALPIVQVGTSFYGGPDRGSLSGMQGFHGLLRALPKRGLLRWTLAVEFDYGTGAVKVSGDDYAADLFGGGVLTGVQFHPFYEGRVLPYLSLEGLLGWHLLRLGGATGSTEPISSGITYGAVISAGADLRLGSLQGNALRLETGAILGWSDLAGVSGFRITGFRISIGIVWD
ncbi:MAG: hypothetical protein IT285_04775 [Bdellovibrionales bacterium]|nr:hypothetical protein [Bdellovibrionales bacterium]